MGTAQSALTMSTSTWTESSQIMHAQANNSAGTSTIEERSLPSVSNSSLEASRIKTPKHLLKKNTARFVLRIMLALTIISAASACMLSRQPLLFILGLAVQGAMYVHLIELQHSVLHLHAFANHRMNRFVGFMLGLPMMISFSDFQYRHLRHHKFLGTRLNTETFDYKHTRLNSVLGFLQGILDYSRWNTLAGRLIKAFTGQQITDGLNPLIEKRVAQEYRLFGITLMTVSAISFLAGTPWPLILWLCPLLAAEPAHFMLELPEHFGLPAHSNASVFENTRAWGGTWFARWYSHNTNFHIAHHFNQLVPMDNLPQLQPLLEPYIPETSRSTSWPAFWLQVMKGEIEPFIEED